MQFLHLGRHFRRDVAIIRRVHAAATRVLQQAPRRRLPGLLLVRLQQPVTSGLARFGNSLLYVSNGTGYWGPPMRLGSPAEITQLVLEARPPAAAAAVP